MLYVRLVLLYIISDSYHTHDNQIVLECKLSGNPKPNIYWQKDNTLLPIENSKYGHFETDEGITQLLISNPLKEDSGLYTCYAENESGQVKISKFLDVSDHIQRQTEKKIIQGILKDERIHEETDDSLISAKSKTKEAKLKLNIKCGMKPLTIGAGNKAQLICHVNGIIEEVYWLRGEERVTKDMRHKIYNINGALSLEIYDTKPEDSGQYKCVIKNSKNTIENSCVLNIYDGPGKTLPTSFLSDISGNTKLMGYNFYKWDVIHEKDKRAQKKSPVL